MESTLAMARQGRPFLMNLQSYQTTQERLDGFRQTMTDSSYDGQTIIRTVRESWAWRNVVVAETDAAAESLGVPAFLPVRAYLADNRKRLNTAEEQAGQTSGLSGAARDSVDHDLIFGSPESSGEDRHRRPDHTFPTRLHALGSTREQPSAFRGAGGSSIYLCHFRLDFGYRSHLRIAVLNGHPVLARLHRKDI